MARRRPSDSSANSLPGRHGGLAERNTVNLDAFVSDVYLPHGHPPAFADRRTQE